MRQGSAVFPARGELEVGAAAGHLQEHSVVPVVIVEAADLRDAEPVPIEPHELVQALGMTSGA